jgi:hypothetical protein
VLVVTLLVAMALGLNSSGRDSTPRAPGSRAGVATAPTVPSEPVRVSDTAPPTTTVIPVPPVAAATTTTTLVMAPVKVTQMAVAAATTTTTTTTTPVMAPVKVTQMAVAAAVVPPAASPSVSQLVAAVEAAGIEPGSNWSWSMGDTATRCGAMTGAGTGCTYGANSLEFSVFSGSPTLALVAHELANAETQNDAVPDLLSEVSAAEAGTSWSPTDAVASCLVAHFMGFQDQSAGPWQCPAALAANAAANIHDSL